jgi:hypothetical protein
MFFMLDSYFDSNPFLLEPCEALRFSHRLWQSLRKKVKKEF